MNKFIFLLFVFSLFLIPNILAEDIGFIVKNSDNPLDYNVIINSIEDLGYSYDLIDDSDIPSTDFDDYKMILVWDESLPHYKDIPVTTKKSLVANHIDSYLSYWKIASGDFESTSTGYWNGKILNEHMITSGLTSPIKLYDSSRIKLNYLRYLNKRALGLKNIVSTNEEYLVVGIIEKQGKLYGGGTAEAETVFFGIMETDYWTQESEQLFKNSLKWLLGEDRDSDGYYPPEDCDDLDDEINPGSDDVYKNCINDAPILIEMQDMEWGRDGNLEKVIDLNNYFEDPEEDELIFSIENDLENILVDINEGLLSFSVTEDWNKEDWIILKKVNFGEEYDLKATASDGEFEVYQLWNVLIKSVSDLTCEEIEGFIFNENEICLGDIWGVYDIDYCCSIEPELAFSDIDRCEIKEDIEIEIKGLKEEYEIKEIIDFKVEINNNLEDSDFDINVYLYDLDEDEIIEEIEKSLKINKDEDEAVDFELEIPEDIEEEHEYAVFVKIEDNSCNEKYEKINIKRTEHKVVIEDIEMNNKASCGDYIYPKITIKNIGNKNENIYIKIINEDLGIEEQSETFKIEKYGENDEIIKKFEFKIPDNSKGEYELDIAVFFEDDYDSKTISLNLDCKEQKESLSKIEKIFLKNGKEKIKEIVGNKIFVILVISSIVSLISFIIGVFYYKKA